MQQEELQHAIFACWKKLLPTLALLPLFVVLFCSVCRYLQPRKWWWHNCQSVWHVQRHCRPQQFGNLKWSGTRVPKRLPLPPETATDVTWEWSFYFLLLLVEIFLAVIWERSFSVVAPELWNAFSQEVRPLPSCFGTNEKLLFCLANCWAVGYWTTVIIDFAWKYLLGHGCQAIVACQAILFLYFLVVFNYILFCYFGSHRNKF